MPSWIVRRGAVRRVQVHDEGAGRACVFVRLHSGGLTIWTLFSKTLCDLCHVGPVSVQEMLDVLYGALPPGRRACLTRWLRAPGWEVES